MKHSALRPAHIGAAQSNKSWPLSVFALAAPPPSSLRLLSPPPSGSGRKRYRRKCSALYGSVAFYLSVAGLRVTGTFSSLALRLALRALRQCGWSLCGGRRGLGVSGGNPSSRCWPGLETMDVGELLSYQVCSTRRAGGASLHPDRGRVVEGPEPLHLTSSHLCPRPGSPRFSCHRLLFSFHSPETFLDPFQFIPS